MKRLLISLLLCLSVLFVSFQFYEQELYASGIRAVILLGLTILYVHEVKSKRFYFFMFLTTYCFAEILNFIASLYPADFNGINYYYYVINALFITAYIFLIVQVVMTIKFKELLKVYPFHIIILFILDAFCVVLITATTEESLDTPQYVLEFLYNCVIMVLVSVALLNYIHHDNKKAMNLLLGTIFIVFSEVIQLAYFYVAEFNFLNVICSLFFVIAFMFFYLQARLKNEPNSQQYHNARVQELEI